MPRKRRVVLPDHPHHILQRSSRGQVVFGDEQAFSAFLENIRELKSLYRLRVYGWCLLPDHFHLLVNPGSDVNAMGAFMKSLSSRVTRRRNRIESRSGTLWESRYRSSPVHSDWVLPVVRYIDRRPVDTGLVEKPGDYRWSSYRAHVEQAPEAWMDPFVDALPRAPSRDDCHRLYRDYAGKPPGRQERQIIDNAVRRNQLTGGDAFSDRVEELTGVRITNRGRGRPPKQA